MAAQNMDAIAKQLGFPNAQVMLAYQQRQHEIQSLPETVAKPAAKAPPPTPAQSILDHIMQYLPLGSLQKAGNAMGK